MTMNTDISECLKQFAQLSEVPEKVADEAYKYFVGVTPVRSGNARRKTRQQGTTIVADYPYAERLDNGYSPQAPRGMVEPTLKEVERLLEKEIKKIG